MFVLCLTPFVLYNYQGELLVELKHEIIDLIKSSSKILIGLGSDVYRRDSLPDNAEKWHEIKKYIDKNSSWSDINNSLYEMIKDKDFFIVTSSWDSHLEEILPDDRLFTPSGNCHKLQCYNACTNQLWDIKDLLDVEDHPLCPYCQSPLVMNIKTDAFFVRSIYQNEETNYHNWIHKNYNEELLILEWEANESDSRLIREQFENIASALPKTRFVRINSRKVAIPEVICKNSIELKITSKKFAALLNSN